MKKNYTDGKLLRKIQKRLLKVVEKEYRGDGLFVELEKFEMYLADGPIACLEVRYGKFNNDDATDWQRTIELPITDGSIEFLAGQFYQRIYDFDQGLLEE